MTTNNGQQLPAESLFRLYAAMQNAVAEYTDAQPERAAVVRRNMEMVDDYIRQRKGDLRAVSAGAVIDAFTWLDEFLTDGRPQDMESLCRDWNEALENLEIILRKEESGTIHIVQ